MNIDLSDVAHHRKHPLISPIEATSGDDNTSDQPPNKRRFRSQDSSPETCFPNTSEHPGTAITSAPSLSHAPPAQHPPQPSQSVSSAAMPLNSDFSKDNFSRLSDEVILNVFSYLPKKALLRCGTVSKRFHAVAMDESLWTRLDLGGRTVRAGALGRAIGRGLVVLRLAQTTIAEPIFAPGDLPADYSSRLQFLDLSMANVSPSGLLDLLRRCRQLKKLSLEHVQLNDAVCAQIGHNDGLEVLNLAMAEGLTVAGVRLLCERLQSLQTLNISWTGLNGDAVQALVAGVTSRLVRLNVAGCRLSMTDALLRQLVGRCPFLHELDLSDCAALSASAIEAVCELKYLEYLSLSRCYNIPVSAYLTINDLLPLTCLDIFGVLSDQALAMLQSSFPAVTINKFLHSAVARPTVGSRRTSVWGHRTRD